MSSTAPRRRYRRFDRVTVQGAAISEWTEECEKPGRQGGFQATFINYEQELSKIHTADHKPRSLLGHLLVVFIFPPTTASSDNYASATASRTSCVELS